MKHNAVTVFCGCVGLAFFLAISSSSAQKQKPLTTDNQQITDDDVVRISTNLVTVPIGVMDHQGRFVSDLKEEQFHLFEDGVEQKIAYFESAEKPFTVALLLDTSDSTQFKLKDIQDAALVFVDQLRPDDRVMVAAFDKSISILAKATSDRGVLESAIRRAQTGGGTGLYNAIDVIIRHRLSRIRGRKAIVLFTDGVDTGTKGPTYESTLHLSEELDALVYAIQYNTYDETARKALDMDAQAMTAKGERLDVAYARAERYLRLLSDKTGGRFYSAASQKHLREVFTTIARELREQYSLGYYPKSAGQDAERRIKVKVSVPGVAVKARRGYVYKAGL
jgi:Ca-activated chloride channel homolog